MISHDSDDQLLWEAVRNDDETAFNILFKRYWSTIYSTSFKYVKSAEVCSEITHDIFLNIWVKRRVLNIRTFPGYLACAARYHVYRHIKQMKSLPQDYVADLPDSVQNSAQNEGEGKIRSIELQERVAYHLDELPQQCRKIFMMSRHEHLPNSEIANQLGISKRTVENYITSALKHLRTSLGLY